MGAALGGGSQSVFGGRGSQTFLGKVTSVCALIFMATSLTLAYHSSRSGSVVKPQSAAPAPPAAPAPVQPVPPAPLQSAPSPASQAPAAPASHDPAAPAGQPAAPAPAPKR